MTGVKVFFSIIGTIVLVTYFTAYTIPNPPPSEIKFNFTPLLANEKIDLDLNLLQKNDYKSLLDIKFQFKILNPICNKTEEPPFLLILIHSSSDHFRKRQMIRDTWGKSAKNVKVAFIIGQSIKEAVNEQLKVESSRHEDIIQGDFLDTYSNLTYKHTMGMKFFIYHCFKAKYIVKVDDDILVNIRNLIKFLSQDISSNGAKDVIMCNTIVHARTLRSYRSKWRISFDEYPYRYFPTYCRGMAIIYSPDIVFNLYNKAQKEKKYVRLEDVFYTGITAEKIGYNGHTSIEHLMSYHYKRGEGDIAVPLNLKSYLFVGSELSERDILKLWNLLEKDETPFLNCDNECTI